MRKIKLYKKKLVISNSTSVLFYRRVETEKQMYWERCSVEVFDNDNKPEYLWVRVPNPFQPRWGDPSSEKKLEHSNSLEFLVLMGCTPESIKRIKRKKVER